MTDDATAEATEQEEQFSCLGPDCGLGIVLMEGRKDGRKEGRKKEAGEHGTEEESFHTPCLLPSCSWRIFPWRERRRGGQAP